MTLSRRSIIVAGIAILAASTCTAWAELKLPHVIGSHMVLQRDMPAPIWGWADPGEKITVEIAGHTATATADAKRKWITKLPAMPVGGPHEMTISGTSGKIELTDILVGDVWVCSGQSNMQWGINHTENGEQEIARADYPRIRLFSVPMKTAGYPVDDVNGEWKPCSPENILSSSRSGHVFSAVGYFFGREIHTKLDVPVGLIACPWGGRRIEPFTPPVGFRAVPKLEDIVKRVEEATPNYEKAMAKALAKIETWLPTAKQAIANKKRVPPPPPWPKHRLADAGQPTGIYNAMVHPLVPFGIRGAIWYQGESNRADGAIYFEKMQALIGGWREVWGQGDFPFYYVQLAPYRYAKRGNGDQLMLPKIWEAQTASLSIPNTGMAVTVDIANIEDIHPRKKIDVGKRLALWALAKTHGHKDLVYSGPLYKSMSIESGKIRIRFDHAGTGLASRDGKPLDWFEIAGDDKKFTKANAKIDGNTVLISSDGVPKPTAVRFAFHEIAEPNLMNKERLPASPFRTDDW